MCKSPLQELGWNVLRVITESTPLERKPWWRWHPTVEITTVHLRNQFPWDFWDYHNLVQILYSSITCLTHGTTRNSAHVTHLVFRGTSPHTAFPGHAYNADHRKNQHASKMAAIKLVNTLRAKTRAVDGDDTYDDDYAWGTYKVDFSLSAPCERFGCKAYTRRE